MNALPLPDERPADLDSLPAPRSGSELPDNSRVQVLAALVDCLTEADLCALARIKPSTAESWRKRGTGPAYVFLGNRALYPREGIKKFIEAGQRGSSAPCKSLL